MRLVYRGIPHEYNPSEVPVVDSAEIGKYRGAPLHFHKLLKAITQPARDLKYRGVAYHTGAPA